MVHCKQPQRNHQDIINASSLPKKMSTLKSNTQMGMTTANHSNNDINTNIDPHNPEYNPKDNDQSKSFEDNIQ
jgi:hypothetical protein